MLYYCNTVTFQKEALGIVLIFQRHFLRGLHILLEGLTFGRAYIRWEICVTKSIGLASSWNGSKKKSYYIHRGDFGLRC